MECAICGNIVASVFAANASHFYAHNATESAYREQRLFANAAAAFFGFEVIILPVIVIAISAVGFASVRRIRAAVRNIQSTQLTSILSSDDVWQIDSRQKSMSASVASAGHLKRQIMSTCGVVFVSFLFRTAFTTMAVFGIAFFHNISESNSIPHSRCDDIVVSEFGFMFVWLLNSPEVFFGVTLVSQPVTLLVALWGMTSGQTIAFMRANKLELPGRVRK